MENPEYVFQLLEVFSKLKNKEISKELEEYMNFVARTGDPVFQWSFVKVLLKEKLLTVLNEFLAENPALYIPPCPNVDPFNYEVMRTNLLDRLDSFVYEPFTVQRIFELLVHPRKEYSRIDKFMRAIEKNILVVTMRDAHLKHFAETESAGESVLNGILYTNDTHNIYSHSDINDLEEGNRSLSTTADNVINDWAESSTNHHYEDGAMEQTSSMDIDNDKEMQIEVEKEQLNVCDDVVSPSFVGNLSTVEKFDSETDGNMLNEDSNATKDIIIYAANSGEVFNDQVSQVDCEQTVVTELSSVSTNVAVSGRDLENSSAEMNADSSMPDETPNSEFSFSNSGNVNKNVECRTSDEMNSSIGSSSDSLTPATSDKHVNDAVFEDSTDNRKLIDGCNFDTNVEAKEIIDSLILTTNSIIPRNYEQVECDSSNFEQNPKIDFIENDNDKSDAIKAVQEQDQESIIALVVESNLVESSEAIIEAENRPIMINIESEHVQKETFFPPNKNADLTMPWKNEQSQVVVKDIEENEVVKNVDELDRWKQDVQHHNEKNKNCPGLELMPDESRDG